MGGHDHEGCPGLGQGGDRGAKTDTRFCSNPNFCCSHHSPGNLKGAE